MSIAAISSPTSRTLRPDTLMQMTASTGKPMAAGLTRTVTYAAPLPTIRSSRWRTVGCETPTARAMSAFERRPSSRSSRRMALFKIVERDACQRARTLVVSWLPPPLDRLP